VRRHAARRARRGFPVNGKPGAHLAYRLPVRSRAPKKGVAGVCSLYSSAGTWPRFSSPIRLIPIAATRRRARRVDEESTQLTGWLHRGSLETGFVFQDFPAHRNSFPVPDHRDLLPETSSPQTASTAIQSAAAETSGVHRGMAREISAIRRGFGCWALAHPNRRLWVPGLEDASARVFLCCRVGRFGFALGSPPRRAGLNRFTSIPIGAGWWAIVRRRTSLYLGIGRVNYPRVGDEVYVVEVFRTEGAFC
jgi:hypothetical protein